MPRRRKPVKSKHKITRTRRGEVIARGVPKEQPDYRKLVRALIEMAKRDRDQ